MMTGLRAIGTPLPASSTRGEVSAGFWGELVPGALFFTSPLVGEVGRGDCDPTIAVETSA